MKVLVVDDHPIVRSGVKAILLKEFKIYEAYEASNKKEALSLLEAKNIDFAIIDLKLKEEDGLDIISEIKQKQSKVKFIVISSAISNSDFIRGEHIGVDGYILKSASIEDLIYAVKTVNREIKYYHPSIIQYKLGNNMSFSVNSLTSREKDILMEVSRGLSNIAIAKKLFLSESTVKKHVSSILGKLSLSKRSQVAYYMNSMELGGIEG